MELMIMLFIGLLILNLLTLSSTVTARRPIHIYTTPERVEGPGCFMIVLGFFALVIILALLIS